MTSPEFESSPQPTHPLPDYYPTEGTPGFAYLQTEALRRENPEIILSDN